MPDLEAPQSKNWYSGLTGGSFLVEVNKRLAKDTVALNGVVAPVSTPFPVRKAKTWWRPARRMSTG